MLVHPDAVFRDAIHDHRHSLVRARTDGVTRSSTATAEGFEPARPRGEGGSGPTAANHRWLGRLRPARP